jgi:O-acetyl-ADP-ribose deacetylase (regulator of RNase III)
MAAAVSALEYVEVKGDLFSSSVGSSLAHCVSEDLHMGKGIATLFKKQFGRVDELKSQGIKVGGVATLRVDNRYIYYLVTKKRYFHKPTYDTLRLSLVAMRDHMIHNNVTELSMPKIGCGLDQLSWDSVKKIVHETFNDLQIKITVYYI